MAMENKVNDEIAVWEEKCEDLIALAMNAGADVAIRDATRAMIEDRIYEDPALFLVAQSILQEGIAAAKREQVKRAFRRPLVLKLKSLFGLHVGS